MEWQHPSQSQISILEEGKSYVPKVVTVCTVPALRELIFRTGGWMLNKPEKSYKGQDAIKLLTRGLNTVSKAREGVFEEL